MIVPKSSLTPYLKVRIKDLFNYEKEIRNSFVYLILNGVTSSKVRVLGKITRIYEYKNRVELVVNDGTSEIVVKVWEDKMKLLENIKKNDTVEVFGILKIYRENLYISPDYIIKRDEKFVTLRKLEYELIKRLTYSPR